MGIGLGLGIWLVRDRVSRVMGRVGVSVRVRVRVRVRRGSVLALVRKSKM